MTNKKYPINLTRKEYILLITATALLAITATLATTIHTLATTGDNIHTTLGCEGINQCYTGKNFMKDIYCIQDTKYENSPAKTPWKLLKEGGDCKSTSNAIKCLCTMYNKTCKFYTTISINEKTREENATCILNYCITGHLGIRAQEGNTWKTLN